MRLHSLLLAGFLLLATGSPAFAATANTAAAPQAEASPALDNEFLLLPAYDLEREGTGPVKIGDRIVFKVTALKGAGNAVSVPAGTPPLLDSGWTIFPEPSPDSLKLIAVALKAGDLMLPSLAILDASGKAIGRTNPTSVKAESNLAANEKREAVPMRPPVSLSFPKWIIVLGVLFALAVAGGLIYGIVRWSRRKLPALAPAPAGPPKPEDEVALAALIELEKLGLARKGDYKGHYFRISEILKSYIGARFRFDAPESTAREIVVHLEEQKATNDRSIDRLETLLNRLDLVKFTDQVPAGPEPALVLEDAREWVRVTRRPIPSVVVSESPKP